MTPAHFDLLLTNVRLATLRDGDGYGAILDAALGVRGGTIAWVGAARELPRDVRATKTIDARQRWATPGLIDCHTHLVYAGNRANEFEQRLEGVDIRRHRRGRRRHSIDGQGDACGERRGAGRRKLRRGYRRCSREGVTTVEIKSGYGLDTANELQAIARRAPPRRQRRTSTCGRRCSRRMRCRRSSLAAPTTTSPTCARTPFPRPRREGLADAVDAFCETIGFTAAQTRRVFDAARAHRSAGQAARRPAFRRAGAALAAEYGALSADHLEYTSEAGVAAMARAGTVAVLLPGAFYCVARNASCRRSHALRAHGVPIAIATDCNPGTSPATSLPLMMNMACTLLRLTPREALAGARATRPARSASRIAVRLPLDCAPTSRSGTSTQPAELAYRIGGEACAGVIREGRVVRGTL